MFYDTHDKNLRRIQPPKPHRRRSFQEIKRGLDRDSAFVGGQVLPVDLSGSIQAAIDTVANAGGGIVQLMAGTYRLTEDINMRSGVTLQGVGPETVLDFDGNDAGIRCEGTLVYNTGTLAMTDGDATVTGTGTTWTDAMVGMILLVEGTSYEILSRTSNTSIEVYPTYYGPDLAGKSYTIFDPVSNLYLTRFALINSGGTALYAQYVAGELVCIYFNIYDCEQGIIIDKCELPVLNAVIVGIADGDGVKITDSASVTIDSLVSIQIVGGHALYLSGVSNSAVHNAEFSDASGNGINLVSCTNIGFENLSVSRNTGQGIELVSGCSALQFHQVNVEGNGGDGLKVTATGDRNNVGMCNFQNNTGWGVNIANANCDDNVVGANTYDNNTAGEVSDSGTGTVTYG